jgi:hypothetical protein
MVIRTGNSGFNQENRLFSIGEVCEKYGPASCRTGMKISTIQLVSIETMRCGACNRLHVAR